MRASARMSLRSVRQTAAGFQRLLSRPRISLSLALSLSLSLFVFGVLGSGERFGRRGRAGGAMWPSANNPYKIMYEFIDLFTNV